MRGEQTHSATRATSLMDPETPEIQAKLEIMFFIDGRIGLAGCIDNKILAYGLLGAGRKALDDYQPAKQERPTLVILPPRFDGRTGGGR